MNEFIHLKIIDRCFELLALKQIWNSGVEAPLCQSNHLSTDSNATLVQETGSIFVAVTDYAENIFFWNANVVEVKDTGARCTNSQLVFFLADNESRCISINNKCGNALVALRIEVKALCPVCSFLKCTIFNLQLTDRHWPSPKTLWTHQSLRSTSLYH